MKEVNAVRLELATSPETRIYEGVVSDLHANYTFDRISGIDIDGKQLGEAGEATTVLHVPQAWALLLWDYMSENMQHTKRNVLFQKSTVPTKHPKTNCHGFADYMTGGSDPNLKKLDDIIAHGLKLVDLQTRPGFGEWLAFGAQGPTDNTTLRYDGRRMPIRRFNEAYHSAIALGEVSTGACIQVTTGRGYLSLDKLEQYQNYVRGFDTFGDDLSWYQRAAII